jgi:hypothetical protein
MVEKRTRAGVAYYWRPPFRDMAKSCPVHAEALGSDYGGAVSRARLLNDHLDAWRNGLGEPKSIDLSARFGTIDWWIETYVHTDALFEPERGHKSPATGRRTPRLYSLEHARHLVQKARAKAGLPKHVTLAACRHGGMTELGDAGLTEPQIMSSSAHETPAAARLYVKRRELRRVTAARTRRQFVERGT